MQKYLPERGTPRMCDANHTMTPQRRYGKKGVQVCRKVHCRYTQVASLRQEHPSPKSQNTHYICLPTPPSFPFPSCRREKCGSKLRFHRG